MSSVIDKLRFEPCDLPPALETLRAEVRAFLAETLPKVPMVKRSHSWEAYDAEFSAQTEFGERLVNSLFTLGLLVGLTVYELTLGTTIANLGFERVEFPAPLFHGDTLHAETTVTAARASKSRPDAGIVSFEHRGYNQRDELVALCVRAALMRRRPA